MQARTDLIKTKNIGTINVNISKHAVTLVTDRLTFKSYNQMDSAQLINQLYGMLGNPRNVEMFCEGEPWSQSRVKDYVDRYTCQWSQGNLYAPFAVFDSATQELIGNLGIYYPVHTYEEIGRGHRNVAEIGYIVDIKHWGKGFGLEMATVGKKYINNLARQLNVGSTQEVPVEVTASSHPDNEASKKILKKVLKGREDVIFKKHNGNPRLMFFKPIKPPVHEASCDSVKPSLSSMRHA